MEGKCDCRIEYYEGFKDKSDHIIYCPLHNSAPDLYGACNLMLEALKSTNWAVDSSIAIGCMQNAIAKAEG